MNLQDDPRFSVRVEMTVPFHDVDAMGVVWHGNYFRYFEVAREALLKQFDYGYRQMQASGYIWPIVDTRVKYIAPLRFEQRVIVCATLQEYENRLRIGYQILDAESGQRTTSGYTIQVAVEASSQEMCFAAPQVLLDKLEGKR
ncbi:acyl-CoA thioesterase [Serratia rhizosphaerae]|uniref:Acyl-CoA thioesterase n=1 Tax=Serratia rhizosphaerae TaxID=2597702 RepID=A0ABX6GJP5_9GAMM|nr:thioesterase family protein [Serratia rhizosphaerae]MEB6337718.1 acyl-CoA thioesterase [Serratia rhizosphaerae]QHA86488.1 acyl-CoA thioesterase [Serratia rhizosphaerae]